MDAFVSVYVDGAAAIDDVRAAIEGLPMPPHIDIVAVTEAATDTLACRIAVDLTGTFDEKTQGRGIARRYASQLCTELGVPAFALHDLILAGNSDW